MIPQELVAKDAHIAGIPLLLFRHHHHTHNLTLISTAPLPRHCIFTMPGGIHPPLEVILSWPRPNYIDPIKRPKTVLVVACVFGPLTIALLLARLWVRIRIQRNAGVDDWLMVAAIV